jgi:hypothetical protein
MADKAAKTMADLPCPMHASHDRWNAKHVNQPGAVDDFFHSVLALVSNQLAFGRTARLLVV